MHFTCKIILLWQTPAFQNTKTAQLVIVTCVIGWYMCRRTLFTISKSTFHIGRYGNVYSTSKGQPNDNLDTRWITRNHDISCLLVIHVRYGRVSVAIRQETNRFVSLYLHKIYRGIHNIVELLLFEFEVIIIHPQFYLLCFETICVVS